jgi:hypothetical protein
MQVQANSWESLDINFRLWMITDLAAVFFPVVLLPCKLDMRHRER